MKINIFTVNEAMFKETNAIWNIQKFNDIAKVGSMTGLLKKFRPDGFKQFMEAYFASGIEREEILKTSKQSWKLNSEYGRTEKEIYQLIVDFRKACVNSGNPILQEMDIKEAMLQTYKRLFEQTFNGRRMEIQGNKIVNELLNSTFSKCFCEDASPIDDATYSIDLVIKDKETNISVMGIQVKPIAYLKYKDDKIEQRQLNEKKNKLFIKENEGKLLTLDYQESVSRKIFYLYYDNNDQFIGLDELRKEVDSWK